MKQTAWIFDVDGVLTDPKEKKVPPVLLTQLVTLIARGDIISFNTGRSLAWIKERIITPLRAVLPETTFLQDIFAVGEKGATWLEFSESGEEREEKDESFIVSESVREKVRKLVMQDFNDCVFFDETKQTMISIEMHDGFDLAAFQQRQKDLAGKINAILEETGTKEKLKLDASIIATDIEDVRTDKANGINRLLTFFKAKGFAPETFTVIGDNRSDLAMADALFAKGKPVQFIFVGAKELLSGEVRAYSIHSLPGYSQGTQLFLEKELKGLSAD